MTRSWFCWAAVGAAMTAIRVAGLVDRVAGNPIDRHGRYRYRFTGPLADPKVQSLGWDPSIGVPPGIASDRPGVSTQGDRNGTGAGSKTTGREPPPPRNLFLDQE